MSAVMVGFPMVILESIYANISFGRNPEMDLLTPLARMIPWFIGAYAIVKFGDLAFRFEQLDFLEYPAATTSLAVEILLGVVAPFLLLLNKAVRRSMGWLFLAVALIIFGVVLNRINVFLVSYTPPYSTRGVLPVGGRDRDDVRDRLEHPVLLPLLRHVLPDPARLPAGDRRRRSSSCARSGSGR